jgi:O-antigen/teichoic acid export membrane protein
VRLGRNFAWLAVAEAGSKVLTFAAIAYLARVVGPDRFGYVEFAISVLLIAGLVVDQGFGPYGAREIARTPARTRPLVTEIVAARILLAGLAYLAVTTLALLLGRASPAGTLLLLYGLGLLALPFLLQWVFQGHELMWPVALMQIIRQAVYAVVIIGFVRTPEQFWLAAVAETLGAWAAAGLGLLLYRRALGGKMQVRFRFSRQLLTEGVPIGLSQMFWTARMFGATAILGIVATPSDMGYFGAAMRILLAAHTFVWLYFFNLLPALSRGWTQADGSYHALVSRSMRLVGVLGPLVALAWVAFSGSATTVIYGVQFAPAAAPLRWLAGVWLLALLSGHYRFGLVAAGRQQAEMVCSALGAVTALAAIPGGYLLGGPAGAAAGLLLAEGTVWLAARLFALRHLAVPAPRVQPGDMPAAVQVEL